MMALPPLAVLWPSAISNLPRCHAAGMRLSTDTLKSSSSLGKGAGLSSHVWSVVKVSLDHRLRQPKRLPACAVFLSSAKLSSEKNVCVAGSLSREVRAEQEMNPVRRRACVHGEVTG